ncbi:J domain-containing protein [Miniimonas arenae]|uniref:J domain-containing protein n=1 Tax=Miniimonas arenae TaxID=676201 RepID=A0A5C5B956_9MICO|nr:DnaJ C-terminal domain-containing protein [Miniimonas arenae]TNU73428.1 J domain-containing protein [Miniimonas arenae]
MTGQDWLEKDFYATLGVAKDADEAAIKKAYRKLARQYHPDQNPGDAKAEATFKEIGEAYSVLSDPEQRKQYDGLRAMAGGGPRFTAGAGGAGGAGGFEDIFSGMFGGGAGGAGGQRVRYSTAGGGGGGFEDILSGMFGGAQGFGGAGGGRRAGFGGPERGADLTATLTLPFRTAVEGGEMGVNSEGRSMTVRIPAGVRDGQKIKLRGKGRPGSGGGENGDLVVTVTVSPHPVFGIDGHNLTVTVPVTFAEAALGATIAVPTFDGGTVRVKVPAGSPSGKRLRVRGRGVVTPKATGDLIVTIEVVVPERLTDEARRAVEAFAAATDGADPRAGLFGAATT